MIILDTDHLSVFARSEGTAATKLRQRIIDHHRSTGELFAVTAISLEEQMRGWLARIGGQRDALRQVESYERLVELVDFYSKWQITQFDNPSASRYQVLRRAKIRIGSMDLKIAAIVLVNNSLLLTANAVDFAKVPGLRFENWLT